MPGRNWQKNQANAKQHPEAELFLFENYCHSSPTLSSINKIRIKWPLKDI